jgi:lactate permease
MAFILAIIPILLILILMVGLRWGAVQAGLAGYLSALAIASLFFGARLRLLFYSHVRALILSLDVLLVIWAAFLLFRVADEAGAIQTIAQALPHLSSDRDLQAMITGWVFASFLQSVGGFGVPVAVTAPILISLGFSPLASVLIPSIGHGWMVTFGTLALSFQTLVSTSGLPGSLLAPPSALFLGLVAPLIGLMVAHAAGGWKAVRRLWWVAAILGATMGLLQYQIAVHGLWPIAAFGASLVGLIFVILLARRFRQANGAAQPSRRLAWRPLLIALSGYALLVVVILSVQMIPLLYRTLGRVVLQFSFPTLKTTGGLLALPPHITPANSGLEIVLFRHTGIVLFYAAAAAFLVYKLAGRYRPGAGKRVLSSTIRSVLFPSLSIVLMVCMAVIMQNAGMTETLANGLAAGTGALFPIAAPWIGAIGAFITGSNTNSNVVFTTLQMRTAQLLGISIPPILAAQTAGAGLGSVLAPAKVVVGTSTAGMSGHEGEVMRRLIGYTAIMVLFISLLAWISARAAS